MLQVTPEISISESDISEEFIRSPGPGGQNVNKVATAVQLRFNAATSPSLPPEVRESLVKLAGKRITKNGVLVINARRFRTREANRRDALARFLELIRRAAEKPKPRRRTKPGPSARGRRLDAKHRKGEIKRLRGPIPLFED
jgi:ribosome-associated protein